jgi:hypothetical protein
LVICEDLGRVCRRMHAHLFCESCEDADTRLVALNDSIDTEREDWQLNSFFTTMRSVNWQDSAATRTGP